MPRTTQMPNGKTSSEVKSNDDVAMNDRQNGWQNGPCVDSANDDRDRDSWHDRDTTKNPQDTQ